MKIPVKLNDIRIIYLKFLFGADYLIFLEV